MMDANLSAQVLENVALVSIIVKHLQLWGLRMAYINLAFAKEARCCRAEYMTVFACVEALTRTLEGTELQEGVLENKPYLRLSAEEDDKLFSGRKQSAAGMNLATSCCASLCTPVSPG